MKLEQMKNKVAEIEKLQKEILTLELLQKAKSICSIEITADSYKPTVADESILTVVYQTSCIQSRIDNLIQLRKLKIEELES